MENCTKRICVLFHQLKDWESWGMLKNKPWNIPQVNRFVGNTATATASSSKKAQSLTSRGRCEVHHFVKHVILWKTLPQRPEYSVKPSDIFIAQNQRGIFFPPHSAQSQRIISKWEKGEWWVSRREDKQSRGGKRLNYSTAALSLRFSLQRLLMWIGIFVWDSVWVLASQRQRALSPTRPYLASYLDDELIRRTTLIFYE